MLNKLFNKKSVIALTSLVATSALALGLLFVPAVAQAAAPGDDPAPTPGALSGAALEYGCNQEKLALEAQQNRLDFSNEVAGQAQTWIDQLKSQGKDTSSLETALATFKTAITTAQGQHDTAQNAFNTQAGFDGNCKVTDREQARATVRTVREDARIAHVTIASASLDFRIAVRQWRQTNRPLVSPTATP